MENTPKSLRLQIALFGRANVGKSSFLNLISGQDVAITSPVPGTTTDVVEKTMELLPLGPVVFLDTAGIDDVTELGAERVKRSMRVFNRADIAVVLCEAGRWGAPEETILAEAKEHKIPVVAVVNKCDLREPDAAFLARLKEAGVKSAVAVSSVHREKRENYIADFKKALIENVPEDFIVTPPLIGDLVKPGGLVVLIVPIDLQAPKGRLILPQVQTIRDLLDRKCLIMSVTTDRLDAALDTLVRPPKLIITDSQVFGEVYAKKPAGSRLTSFSVLMAGYKGDIDAFAEGARALGRLGPDSRVLIAEACAHAPLPEDIGRVKIPRLLRNRFGEKLHIEWVRGTDFPENLNGYDLVIHCGACMFNRTYMLGRQEHAAAQGVPMTNYGVALAWLAGILDRIDLK